jgi:outer membrane protein assembly factor BamD (BamD/ComL family)
VAPATPAAEATPPQASAAEEAQPVPQISQLEDESALLQDARDALRGGDFAKALATTERARKRFPHGALGQEREVIAIDALSGSGRREEAAKRARSFLQTYPRSPLAPRVRTMAGD